MKQLCIFIITFICLMLSYILTVTFLNLNDSYNHDYKLIQYEPVRVKTNNLGSDQVWHKPAGTVTEDG